MGHNDARILPSREVWRRRKASASLVCWIVSCVVMMIFHVTDGSHFKSTAFLDRATGIATSFETSDVPSNLFESPLAKHPKDVFSCYPLWLCQGSVTLGILQAECFSYGRNKRGFHVKDRMFGKNILSFGQPTSSSLHVKWRDAEHGGMRSSRKASISIPIVGGCLARKAPNSDTFSGSLRFTLVTSSNSTTGSRIETEITNDYRPTLAGRPPISALRGLAYRSTQTTLHSYIMWRFHRFCYRQGEKANDEGAI